MSRFRAWRSEEGQTMAEYSIVLAVITPLIVGALATLGYVLAGHFDTITGHLS